MWKILRILRINGKTGSLRFQTQKVCLFVFLFVFRDINFSFTGFWVRFLKYLKPIEIDAIGQHLE